MGFRLPFHQHALAFAGKVAHNSRRLPFSGCHCHLGSLKHD
nr:hypothetical protein [uncultured Kingella sp.]